MEELQYAIAPAVLAALIGLGGTVANYIGARRGQKKQLEAQQEALAVQRDYDRPVMQMARFQEAGLNPNLVYSQGSAGNQSRPMEVPNYQEPATTQFGSQAADLVLKYQQAKLMESQRDLTDNRVIESTIRRDLMGAQRDLVKANPYMRKEYVDSMVRNLKGIADLKEQEAGFRKETVGGYVGDTEYMVPVERGYAIMQQEFDRVVQRFKLETLDQKMKAELIQGKGFQNALSEIQMKWMKNAEITPQHIYLFIQMLLSKML